MSSAQRSTGPLPAAAAALDRFNALPEDAATAVLHDVCSSAAWVRALLDGRPYATLGGLLAAQDAATAALTATDLAEAMAGHPPIGDPAPRGPADGDPAPGDPAPGDPAPGGGHSAREQAGMARASERLKEEMTTLNRAYRERFGHVFLICASGLSAGQMRDALAARLRNTPDREREIVRTELAKINRIRLTRLATAQEERT
ncbi:2-oxo-4-hydroxy-4-carboxy-5-ureidoimidazoline decarboxylase [Streptomyces sp. TS71-3]|uniref:2-oxo-4-hydroxy-4-carboxy-5-ureidoimidazoline decarboxylase n=1 Tax=Streptomyces sp. TS71-3 TaxID=2733862 RepID=UPI001B2439C2|nr:2-oxo-4-hydroxy-4-carboxy-5-ureidoimidazoline decarboxylase [Streptomyces sp. TS71-3]GHJ41108.1 2-oxo-4-hydroxy-4-carboxy-5-ureidoimidazoline decarboxylase [Streptomyces sp. TS71-3]